MIESRSQLLADTIADDECRDKPCAVFCQWCQLNELCNSHTELLRPFDVEW